MLRSIAQEPLADNIYVQNGLPCSEVYSMLQDKNGYIWLGSEKGLIRFDGLHYKIFSNKEIKGSSVSDLRIDTKGVLRCQSFSGGHYYLHNDSLYADEKMPLAGDFSPVYESKRGIAYQIGYNELYSFGSKKEILKYDNQLLGLFEYKESVFVFDSIQLYDVESSQPIKNIPFSLHGETVFFFTEFAGKMLVFPRSLKIKTAYSFFPQFEQLDIDLPSVFIQSVDVVNDTLLFISTNNGLYVLNKNLRQLPIKQPLLEHNSLSGVIRDLDGAIWASTVDNGIYRFGCFNCVTATTTERAQTLFSLPDGSGVLYGTQAGNIYKWAKNATVDTVHISGSRQTITALYKPDNQTLLVGGDVFTICEKGEKPIEFRLAVKEIVPLSKQVYALARTGNISFLSRREHSVDTANMVTRFIVGNWQVYDRYTINQGNVRIHSMVCDSVEKELYAATTIGLLQANEKGWHKIEYNQKPLYADDIALRNDTLFAISDATVYILKKGKVLSVHDVLPASEANAVQQIKVHSSGIWIASGKNMYKVDDALQHTHLFELTQGYEINDFRIVNNQLVLATDIGITAVAIQHLVSSNSKLRLFVTQFSANEEKLNRNRENKLQHTFNNLKIVFSIPYYGKQEEVNVYYKINDKPWKMAENSLRELNLLSLEPGKYSVQLKATAAGRGDSEVETIAFTIRPPFWKTWWFYALSLLLVAGTAYLLYRYRLHLIQKQNALEKQKMELEGKLRESILASVKAQMNPHFIFNALNTIQSFIYLNDKANATNYLGKFSQLTRTILEMSNKKSVSLQEEIDAILLYLELEKTRFDDELEFSIEVSGEVNPLVIHIPAMIIQPYIENAIKHGLLHKRGNRMVKCMFELKQTFLKVTIDDNGIGRVRSQELNKIKSKKHQSFATHANEKRLEALNRGSKDAVSVHYIDKISEQGEALGTTVELMILVVEE